MPVVSIVMPAYNAAQYLELAIESAVAQTFTDWELIVVDDGSTDDTAAIVEAARARDPRVHLIRQPNGGVSRARNAAVASAAGAYLALLDSDDVWEPGFLQAQVAILDGRPDIAVVTGNGFYLGGPRHGQPVHPCPDPRPQPTTARILADETSIFIMSVFRRAAFDAVGGFDVEKRGNEDYDFWIRVSLAGFQFLRNDRPLSHYRWRPDSLSANEARMLRGILVVLKEKRPRLESGSEECSALERQVSRFEIELLRSEARAALDARDYAAAARHLDALQRRQPALALSAAGVMARRAPALLAWLYRLRRVGLARAARKRAGA